MKREMQFLSKGRSSRYIWGWLALFSRKGRAVFPSGDVRESGLHCVRKEGKWFSLRGTLTYVARSTSCGRMPYVLGRKAPSGKTTSLILSIYRSVGLCVSSLAKPLQGKPPTIYYLLFTICLNLKGEI